MNEVRIDTSRAPKRKRWHQRAARYVDWTMKAAAVAGTVLGAIVACVAAIETGSIFSAALAFILVSPLAAISLLALFIQVRIAKNIIWSILGL